MKTIGYILVFVLVLGLFAILNTLVHEFGHCFTVEIVGGECESIYVMPGVQVWPLTGFGQAYPSLWEKYIALTYYAEIAPTEQSRGLTSLMGSGSVAILSLLALLGLYLFRPHNWLRLSLLAQSFMFPDLLFYTILPHWFGLRHMFFIGGNTPEPLNGAIRMGISESVFIGGVLIYSAFMLLGCLVYIWKSATRRA
jgi:hypothetical protein